MKVMVIRTFLLILILIDLASGIDFNLDSPEKVTNSEEFIVRILAEVENSEIYDVKIFISNNDKIVSQIYNDGWKNSRYYVQEAFPDKREFKIKSLEEGDFEICARLRKSGKTAFDERCNRINVETEKKDKSLKSTKTDNEEIKEDKIEVEEKEKKEEKQILERFERLNLKKENSGKNEELKEEGIRKITLNNNSTKKEDIFLSKHGKKQEYIVYSFLAFCILLIILLILRKNNI